MTNLGIGASCTGNAGSETTIWIQHVAEEAAEWLEVLDDAGESERGVFVDWLKTSSLHMLEFLRMRALDYELRQLAFKNTPASSGSSLARSRTSNACVSSWQCDNEPLKPQPKMTAYEDYLPALKTFFAARAPEPNAIDDLVQTVYERLLKYAPDETLRDPTAYIFKIALNVLSDANRHARADRQMTVNCDPSELEQYVNDQGNVLRTDNSADVLDNQLEMRRAFERLPRETQVAWLYSRDGYSYKQIAAKMNISEHTVKKFIAAALKHFREHFGATTTAR